MIRNKEIFLANPRGFCAGVDRAIAIVEKALLKYGAPVYVRHEIVHNKFVVNLLEKKGAIFVEEVSEIPEGAVTIFSAHGVAKQVESDAEMKSLDVIDATCPLVKKVHNQVTRNEALGDQIVLIGHSGHPEVEGTSGRSEKGVVLVERAEDVASLSIDSEQLSYVTQTTLSVDDTQSIIAELKGKFPTIKEPKSQDICYATQNRQDAVKALVSKGIDLLYVIGAPNSSNSNRLRDIGENNKVVSYLIQRSSEIKVDDLRGAQKIGVTAGASAPEVLVKEVIDFIKSEFPVEVNTVTVKEENIAFNIPSILQDI